MTNEVTVQGTLHYSGNESFVDANGVRRLLLLLMNASLITVQQRAAAAASFFQQVKHLPEGSPVTLMGFDAVLGQSAIFEVTRVI